MKDSLEKVVQEVAGCKKCPLFRKRTNTVPGDGNSNAEIMFIGEGPGRNEDEQGKPFVGQAGKLLDELIGLIDKKRADVFIANVVKCRPPNNRDPYPEEVKTCWPYLERQVKLIKPKLVVTLGRHSMDRFLPNMKISQIHGKPKRREIENLGKLVFYPIYHPAAALYNPNLKNVLIEDFQRIPAVLKEVEKLN
jgi:DNA polymerase